MALGKAIEFNGSTQYATAPNNALLDFGTGDFSLEAWFKSKGTSGSGYQTILNKGYELILNNGNGMYFYYGGAVILGGVDYRNDNTWHHVVAVRTGSTGKIYVDGVSLGTGSFSAGSNNGNYVLNIGRHSANTHFFNGDIDEVRIYNKALSSTEVADNYNAGVGRFGYAESNLRLGLHFDDEASPTADYSGNGLSATLISSPTFVTGKVNVGNALTKSLSDNSSLSDDSISFKKNGLFYWTDDFLSNTLRFYNKDAYWSFGGGYVYNTGLDGTIFPANITKAKCLINANINKNIKIYARVLGPSTVTPGATSALAGVILASNDASHIPLGDNSGIIFALHRISGINSAQLIFLIGDTYLFQATVPAFSWVAGNWYKMRMYIDNDLLVYCKVWNDADAEPAEWQISAEPVIFSLTGLTYAGFHAMISSDSTVKMIPAFDLLIEETSLAITLSDSIPMTESMTDKPNKKIDDSMSLVDDYEISALVAMSDIVFASEALSNIIGAYRNESIAISDDIQNMAMIEKDDSFILADNVAKDADKNIPDSLSVDDAIIKYFRRSVPENMSIADVISIVTNNPVGNFKDSMILDDTIKTFIAPGQRQDISDVNEDALIEANKGDRRMDMIGDMFKRMSYVARIQMARKGGENEFDSPMHNNPYSGSTGFSYWFQGTRRIFNETVKIMDEYRVRTKYGPITNVKNVRLVRPDMIETYRINNYSEYEILLYGKNALKAHYPVEADYSYRRYVKVKEIVNSDGTSEINVSCMSTSDYLTFNKAGDLVTVASVIDRTTNTILSVVSFTKQTIALTNTVASGHMIEVVYEYAPLINVIATNTIFKREKQIWESLETGTMLIAFQDWVTLGEGDIVTLMGVEQRRLDVLLRGNDDTDQLRAYDIAEILEVVNVEAPSEIYRQGIDYVLAGYDKIKWISAHRPDEGTSYSVNYFFNPCYKISENVPVFQNTDNQRYPKSVMATFFDRVKVSGRVGA